MFYRIIAAMTDTGRLTDRQPSENENATTDRLTLT